MEGERVNREEAYAKESALEYTTRSKGRGTSE